MILGTGVKRGFVISGSSAEVRKASHLPGASFRRKEGVVRLPESIASWKLLRDVEFTIITDSATDKMEALKLSYRQHRSMVRIAHRKFKSTGETAIPVPLTTIPFEHQVRAFGFSTYLDSAALLMDQGTGKTLVAIAVSGTRGIKRVLVICPKAVRPVWPRELAKHAGFEYCTKIDGPPEEDGVQYWITNYDKLTRDAKSMIKWKPDLIILDEAHKIKNRKAKRTAAAIRVGAKVKHKLILSGTILGKCISETWAPLKFLMRDLFGSNFSQFKERYLKMGGFMGHTVTGYQNEDEYADKLHSISFRVTKDECLDLPPLSYQRLYVTPDAETKRIYRDLDKDLYTELEGEEITASSQATKQMKLRQVVGGMVRADSKEISHVSGQKISTLRDVMEDRTDKKTLIFFSFTHEIEMAKKLCDELKLKYLTLQGSTPDKDRDVFETRFQEEPSISVALIQIQTGAEGLTLTSADLAIFYSPTFSFIGFSQARDRFHRIGQDKPVTVLFIIMEKTVDEHVVDVLESNGQLLDEYLEQRRDYNLGDKKMAKVAPVGTTAKEVAEEVGISAADLRKHLRALKIEKPEGGWLWTRKADVASIVKQVKARIASLAEAPAKETKPAAKVAPAKKAPAVKKAPVVKKAPAVKKARVKKPAATE